MSFLRLIFVFFILTACSVPPYVHKSGQFDRSSVGFGQPINDISSVTICYSVYSSTPAKVSKLAIEECSRFGKSASFLEQDMNICPITAPMAAVYSCNGEAIIREKPTKLTDQKGALMNYDGMKFRY